MPNKENIQKLIDALRSGLYSQIRNRSQRLYVHLDGTITTSFCVLGLAGHLSNDFNNCDNWLGISSSDLAVLMRKNDEEYLTFPQLADYLESNYLTENTNAS